MLVCSRCHAWDDRYLASERPALALVMDGTERYLLPSRAVEVVDAVPVEVDLGISTRSQSDVMSVMRSLSPTTEKD
jgi:hypothetical protein